MNSPLLAPAARLYAGRSTFQRHARAARRAAAPAMVMIFVTGATSHTGARLIRRLLARGADEEIVCLVRGKAQARERLKPFAPAESFARLRFTEGDITAPDTFAAAMRGASAVINVAHMRHGPALAALLERNDSGAGAARLICLSSTRRYTRWPDTAARDVIAAEEALERSAVAWTILRAAIIYGGPDDNNIEKLVRAVRRWPVLPLPGGGRNLIQPLFVGDLVEMILAALENPAAARRAYTLAGPKPMEYRAMLRAVAKALGRSVWLAPVPLGLAVGAAAAARALRLPLPAHPDQIRRLGEDKAFDIAEARRELGFAPRPFEEGLRAKLAGEA